MNAPLKLSMLITADASGVTRATQTTGQSFITLRQTTQETAVAMRAWATANEQAAAASRNAMQAATGQAAAERDLRAAVASFAGIRTPENDNTAQRAADLDAYGRSMDALRAKYNPLFAAQQAYLAQLREINAAAKVGALSELERSNAIAQTKAAFAAQVSDINGFARSTELAQHELRGLSFQLNDVITGLLSGQQGWMILAQQSGQVVQILGPRGLGQILPALGQSLTSLLTPTTLLLAGLTAVGYGGVAAFRAIVPEVKSLDDVMQRHAELVTRLKDSYREATDAANAYGRESQTVLLYQLGQEKTAGIQQLQQGAKDIFEDLNGFGMIGSSLWGGGAPRPFAIEPILKPLQDLREEARNGIPDFQKFRAALVAAMDTPLAKNEYFGRELREKVTGLLKLTDALAAAQLKLQAFRANMDLFGRLAPWSKLAGKDMEQYSLYVAAANAQLERMKQLANVSLQALNARSPTEKAAAAEARERTVYNDNEPLAVRRLRIEQAGALALAQAQKALDDAQRSRNASMLETLANAQLDYALLGKTTEEVERLRLEHQLLAQVRAEAAVNNVAVDQAEVARIKALAAEYGRLRALSAAREVITSQAERLAQSRVELALMGQSETTRARVMAQLEAEQEIRKRGIAQGSAEADIIRANAAELAAMNTVIERQSEAWGSVRRSAENSIDGIVDKLSSGNISGALEDLGKDWTKTLLQLGVSNPLKNGLLGTNYGTMQDVGGLSGLLGKLFGGGKGIESVVTSALGAQSVGAMSVTAGTVTITGGIGNIAGLTANTNMPGASGIAGMTSNAGVQGQIWNFFAAKGLKPHQIAGIMGHVGAESGFNPLAVGDGGSAHGLFQWNSRAPALRAFTGGNMSVQKQLEFAWHELQTSENRSFQNLLGSKNVREATAAFGGFERPRGFSWSSPESMHNWNGRLQGAEQALTQFGQKTTSATASLGTFGTGLGNLGQGLGNAAQNLASGVSSGGGGFFEALLGIGKSIGSSLGWFDTGGYTGNAGISQVAGVVHGQEFVVNAGAVRRPGVRGLLEAINDNRLPGYMEGGYVMPRAGGSSWSGGASQAGASQDRPQIVVNNYSSATVRTEEESDGRGGRRTVFVLEDAVADALARPGSPARRTAANTFGLQPRLVRR